MGKIVVTQPNGSYSKINPTKVPKNETWSFSFKYFKQVKYFGLDKSPSTWFVSLIKRFSDLSNMDRTRVFSDKNTKDFYRYHKINWESKNIPISKKDLNWIDKVYLDNDVEFPFYQFQVSTANGRVVGFWNEDHTVFYVILLDPLHNIQPAKRFNYKVDDCYPLSCEYSSLLQDCTDILSQNSNCKDCNIHHEISKLPKKLNQSNAIVGFLDDDFLKAYEELSQDISLNEILMAGILQMQK